MLGHLSAEHGRHYCLRRALHRGRSDTALGTLCREAQRGRATDATGRAGDKHRFYLAKYCPAPLQHGRDDTGGTTPSGRTMRPDSYGALLPPQSVDTFRSSTGTSARCVTVGPMIKRHRSASARGGSCQGADERREVR